MGRGEGAAATPGLGREKGGDTFPRDSNYWNMVERAQEVQRRVRGCCTIYTTLHNSPCKLSQLHRVSITVPISVSVSGYSSFSK
jgi:hypothetical protein